MPKVVTLLLSRTHLLRAIAISILTLMLAAPAASILTGDAPLGGAADGDAAEVGATTRDDRWWLCAAGGEHDVIVIFKEPCVVEHRVGMERGGVTDDATLALAAREHKASLLASHASFLSYVTETHPGVAVNQEFTTVLNGMALTASKEALDRMALHPDVAIMEPDLEVEADLASSVPVINADDMWTRINSTGATISGKGIVVAVLDTGIDYSHPDLGGTGSRASDLANVTSGTHARIVGGWNVVSNTSDFWDGHAYSHGTHCAGIVGANGTVKGVAPDAEFRGYKVLSDGGSGSSSDVVRGVELATDPDEDGDTSDHCDVISMSLSGPGHPDDGKSKAVDNAMDAGAVVTVAASNSGTRYETTRSPSEARKVISVGATYDNDNLATFSSVGPSATLELKPDVLAPGVSVYSTARGGHRSLSGTSMATPHVAGAAALLMQSHPGWSSHQVKRALMGTSKDVGLDAYKQGAGRIDVLAANGTGVLAEPPSVSLGRLSSSSLITNFTVGFENVGTGWANGTLSWSLEWELTPLYAASGNGTDLSSMVRANVTTLNVSAGGSVTVGFNVTYGPSSHVGHHLGVVKLVTSSQTVRVPLAFYVRAPILLVDDDNTGSSSNPPYNNQNYWSSLWYKNLGSSERIGSAMSSLGLTFDVIAVRPPAYLHSGTGPSATELANYRVVIWNCGFDYSPYGRALTDADLAAMKRYVDGDGNLWLSGSRVIRERYGYNNRTSLPSTNDLREVFGLGGFRVYSGTPDPLGGGTGKPLSGVSYDVDVASFGNRDLGNNLTPVDGARQVLSGSDSDYWGGGPWTNITSAIARDGGTNKTLFTAFEFGHVRTASDRKDMVDRVLKWIDLKPHGAFSYNGQLKEGEAINFTGRVLDPRATESYRYEWDLDYDGSTFTKDATGSTHTHTYQDDGTFVVALRVHETRTNSYSALVTRSIDVVNQAPEAHLNTSSPGEEGSPVSFWGNATDPGGNDTFTWEWDFEYDGVNFNVSSTERNATHTYMDDGTYTAALRVTDDEGLTSPVNTTSVVVVNLPPSGTPFTPGTSKEGDNVPFTATVKDPGPLDTVLVQWDFEYDGSRFKPTANGTSVNHTYLDDGTFTVLMRLTDDDGGVANQSLQVTVRNVDPTADFVTSAPVEEGGIVDFNATVTDPGVHDIHTFEWDFDYDGVSFRPTGTKENSSSQYSQDGTYAVALRVSDGDGGEAFVTRDITILNVAPRPYIDGVGSVEEGETVAFMAHANDTGRYDQHTYAWDFGDGSTGTGKNPEHVFDDDGVFNVTVNVTDEAGGSGLAWLRVTVENVAPNATVKATPDHIDENGTVHFQADGRDASSQDLDNLTYTWNFGDGESSNLREVDHRFLDDGEFTVTLTVQDDDGGVAVYDVVVRVNNVAPEVFAKADREYIAEGEVVNFTAVIEDPGVLDEHTVLWDFDDGDTSDQLEVTHRYMDDGNYIVVLTVTDDSGGTNTTTFRVAVSNVRPRLEAAANASRIDEGGVVSFTVTWTDPGEEDTHTVLWDFGDGTNGTRPNTSHRFVQDGTYTVVVTVTDNGGGQASRPFIIDVLNVAPTPKIDVAVTQVEENTTLQFLASHTDPGAQDVVTYHWDFNDGSEGSSEAAVHHHFADNGVFRVTLRALDEDGGISPPTSVSITVINVPPQNLKAAVDLTETTVGKPVTFSAAANDVSPEDTISYSWNFGDLSVSAEQIATHVYTSTGQFKVVLIVADDDGGQTTWEATITVLPDMDGDGIPDDDDDDIDGDGYKNSEDDYPEDPDMHTNFSTIYLLLLIIAVVAAAVAVYVLRPRD